MVAQFTQEDREVANKTKSWSGPTNSTEWLVIINGEGTAISFAMDGDWGLAQGYRGGAFDFAGRRDFPSATGEFKRGAFADKSAWTLPGTVDEALNRHGTPPKALRPYHYNYPADQADSSGWPVGQYAISDILIAEKSSNRESEKWRTLDVLGTLISEPRTAPMNNSGSRRSVVPPEIARWLDVINRDGRRSNNALQLSQLREVQPVFQVKPQVENQIKIAVPQRLQEYVTRYLKAAEQPDRD